MGSMLTYIAYMDPMGYIYIYLLVSNKNPYSYWNASSPFSGIPPQDLEPVGGRAVIFRSKELLHEAWEVGWNWGIFRYTLW